MPLRPVREKWTTRSSADGSLGWFHVDGPGVGEKKWFTSPEVVTSMAESLDGQWRLIAYGSEILWMQRSQLVPVAGSRIPSSGFGLVDLDGAVSATLAAFNKNLDVWAAQRPTK